MVEPQEFSKKKLTLKNFQTFKMQVDSSFDFSENLIKSEQENEHDIVYSEIKMLVSRLKAIIGDQYYQEIMVPKKQIESKTPHPKQQSFTFEVIDTEIEKTYQKIQKSETLNEVKYWVNELGIQMNNAFRMKCQVSGSMKLEDYLKELKLKEDKMFIDDKEWSFQKKIITIDHPRASFTEGKIECQYEGEMKNNVAEGYGQLTYVYKKDVSNINTFTFYGYFKNGFIHGPGYIINGKKFSSVGNYQFGKLQGLVRFYYSNGKLSQIGSSIDGKWDSYCKLYREDGSVCYEGNLAQSLYQGQGKYFYTNGRTFEGIWNQDLKVEGILTIKSKVQAQSFDVERDIKDKISHFNQKPILQEEI